MKAKNEKTIENAFRRFAESEYRALIGGMKALLDAAVVYALRRHEERYLHSHLVTGDSYGWAIGRQGQCVAIKVTAWDDLPTTAEGIEKKLRAMVENQSSNKNRYIGVVMAGMKPAEYYNIEFEEEILDETIIMVSSDFDRYFHEIPTEDIFDKHYN